MNQRQLQIRELAAWGFDQKVDRGSLSAADLRRISLQAQRNLEHRELYVPESPIVEEQTRRASALLTTRREQVAASGEFDGLAWELAIVDLSKLIAFQRRIGFGSGERIDGGPLSSQEQILEFALPTAGTPLPVDISINSDAARLTVRTLSPNLIPQWNTDFEQRSTRDLGCVRLCAYSGSPYMEVASYRERWYLRDGYHRAFRLLSQGIRYTPAVVVDAQSIAQLGAVKSWFFPEDVLFSQRPPMVTDFLEDGLIARYLRPQHERVFHVSIEEQPAIAFADGCDQEGI